VREGSLAVPEKPEHAKAGLPNDRRREVAAVRLTEPNPETGDTVIGAMHCSLVSVS
jgi:hypothetical protein